MGKKYGASLKLIKLVFTFLQYKYYECQVNDFLEMIKNAVFISHNSRVILSFVQQKHTQSAHLVHIQSRTSDLSLLFQLFYSIK